MTKGITGMISALSSQLCFRACLGSGPDFQLTTGIESDYGPAGAAPRTYPSLEKPVSQVDRSPRCGEVTREAARGGQAFTRSKAPVPDCLGNALVNLAVKRCAAVAIKLYADEVRNSALNLAWSFGTILALLITAPVV